MSHWHMLNAATGISCSSKAVYEADGDLVQLEMWREYMLGLVGRCLREMGSRGSIVARTFFSHHI